MANKLHQQQMVDNDTLTETCKLPTCHLLSISGPALNLTNSQTLKPKNAKAAEIQPIKQP